MLHVFACSPTMRSEQVSIDSLKYHISEGNLDAVAEEVGNLPYWIATASPSHELYHPFTEDDIYKYELVAAALSELEVSEIRQVAILTIKQAFESSDGEGLAKKLNFFVLWRILFDIPKMTPYEEARFESVHAGPADELTTVNEKGERFFNERWPVSFNEDGTVADISSVMSMKGARYVVIWDFDGLAERFKVKTF